MLDVPADGHNWPVMLVERRSMGVAYVPNERKISAFCAAALLLSSLSLGGCATSMMDARAEAPVPAKRSVYLPVEDLPPKRDKPVMTPAERSKLQKELIAARDRQAPKAKESAESPQPPKP
jgi:hypothetical protein